MTGNTRLGAFVMGFGLVTVAAVAGIGEVPAGAAASGGAAVTSAPGNEGSPPGTDPVAPAGGVTQEMLVADGGVVLGARQGLGQNLRQDLVQNPGQGAGSAAAYDRTRQQPAMCVPDARTGTDAGSGATAAAGVGAGVGVATPSVGSAALPRSAGTGPGGSLPATTGSHDTVFQPVARSGDDADAGAAGGPGTGAGPESGTGAEHGVPTRRIDPDLAGSGSAVPGTGPETDPGHGPRSGAQAPTDPEGTARGGGLPFTGLPAQLLLAAAGLLCVVGCTIALLTARRRRTLRG